jgi:hypothetical protein
MRLVKTKDDNNSKSYEIDKSVELEKATILALSTNDTYQV